MSTTFDNISKTTHRSFTYGFMFLEGRDNKELTENNNVGYIKKYRFVGSVKGYSENPNNAIIKARNLFKVGDMMNIFQPGKKPKKIKITKMIKYNTRECIQTANTNDLLIIYNLGEINIFSLLRVKT